MENEFYGDGEHNGGVYYHGNLNPYMYTYENPIRYIDPNGKQSDANRSVFYGKFRDEIYSIGRKIDSFFGEFKVSFDLAKAKESFSLGAITYSNTNRVQSVNKLTVEPNIENVLKTVYYNQKKPNNKQKMDKVVKTSWDITIEASESKKAAITTQYGTTTTESKTVFDGRKKNVKNTTTITHGVGENGLYYSADTKKESQLGIRFKLEKGKTTFEAKFGKKWKK